MYGVINKSLRDMVTEGHGEAIWAQVLAKAGVPSDSFLAMRSYDDEITFRLAVASSDVLGVDVDTALHAFGKHWVNHTLARDYDALVRSTGSTMLEFLENLNELHDRISTTFLEYEPPEFRVSELQKNRMEVEYISHREGLNSFVSGLLVALSERFNEPMSIEATEDLSVDAGTHTKFSLLMER
jgi:guanylate cyclase soluble subunit beta